MTAPARIRGYMSCSRSVPVLAAIASARASGISGHGLGAQAGFGAVATFYAAR